jgi:hypothetical protein
MTVFQDFVGAIPTGFAVEIKGIDFDLFGVVEAFDDRHLVLRCEDEMVLMNIDSITTLNVFQSVTITDEMEG